MRQSGIQDLHHLRRGAFLRTIDAGRPVLAAERIVHVAQHLDRRRDVLGRRNDLIDLRQRTAAETDLPPIASEELPAQSHGCPHAAVDRRAAADGEQTCSAPCSIAAWMSWPVPYVVVFSGFCRSRRSNGSPLAIAISTTAVRVWGSQTNPPSTRISGSGPTTSARIHSPPAAAIRVTAVPSPPSAMGFVTMIASGTTERIASAATVAGLDRAHRAFERIHRNDDLHGAPPPTKPARA